MKLSVYLIMLVLSAIPIVGLAETDTKEEKLLKLAQYEDMPEVIKRYRDLCLEEMMSKHNARQIAKDTPEFFGGIEPGSKHWPEVESIYNKYVDSYCSYLTEKGALSNFVTVYSELMSDETLDAVLAFYKSRAGSEYIKATKTGKGRIQAYYAETAGAAMKLALKRYAEELGDVLKKYHEEQSK